MKKIGFLEYDDYKYHFYENENGEICNERAVLYDDDMLKKLAVSISNPWTQDDLLYEIKINCKDAWTKMRPGVPLWKCTYDVLGNDMVTSKIYGFGKNPPEALLHCRNIFEYLQKKYNPDYRSF